MNIVRRSEKLYIKKGLEKNIEAFNDYNPVDVHILVDMDP